MALDNFNFDPRFLDAENIIAKLHLLMQQERSDPYSNRQVQQADLRDRIQTSLSYVPPHLRQYILALFANTIYFTKAYSNSVLSHLLNRVLYREKLTRDSFERNSLVLEVDPTGIVNEFLRHNAFSGRLDKSKFPRKQQVSEFIKAAIQDEGDESIQGFLSRKYWLVLTDNSLSGTSLVSDLKKLIRLAQEKEKDPQYIVLIRTLAYPAKSSIEREFAELIERKRLRFEFGLYLDKQYSVTDILPKDKCRLFSSQDTLDGVIDSCRWLTAQDGYINDFTLADHKHNSGCDMTFGFKKCGLTFVSVENCPSDSLPLLWYRNSDIYVSPFPRVLSRTGGANNVS